MTDIVAEENIPAKKKGKLLQTILSLLIFAGFVVYLFIPKLTGYGTSMLHQILELFKGNFTGSDLSKISLYAVIGMYAVLLVCTVAGFFTQRRGAVALNFIKVLISVAVMAFFAYAYVRAFAAEGTTYETLKELFYNKPTFLAINAVSLSLATGVLAMIVLSLFSYKGKGVVKVIYFLLAGAFFAFASLRFADELRLADLFGNFALQEGTVGTFTRYALITLAYAMIVNAVLAFIELSLPHTGALDLIRGIVMFLICAGTLVLVGVYGSFSNLLQSLATVGVTGVATVQLIYTIIVVVAKYKMRAAREAEEDALAEAAEARAREEAAAAEPVQPVSEKAAEPVPPVFERAAEPAPAPEAQEEPAAQPNPDAEKANAAFEEAAGIEYTEAPEEPSPAEDTYESAIRDEAVTDEEPEEPAFDFNQAKYDGKFNRQYADYVAQEEERARQQQQQSYYGGAQQQPYFGTQQQPHYGAQQQPYYGAPQNAQGGYYGAGFIPDAFISSLTPAERDEFDRLFISRIHGENKRLPAYRIGGDNREFFAKVFVFMGRYRNVISDGLLEKIYSYSNAIR